MTKIEQIKSPQIKPEKPQSRLSELAIAKVVSAGEAFDSDIKGNKPNTQEKRGLPTPRPRLEPAKPAIINKASKRTFRFPKALDSQLKKILHQYNLEKNEEEEDLSMEEIGIVMVKYFLDSNPKGTIKKSRGSC
jgi:hypothetical protein